MIAFLFPGQGSQRQGMGAAWVQVWPELFDIASSVSGQDVRRLVCDADEDELKATDNAQLATAVVSLAAHRALVDAGVRPSVVAGHSLGEYTALIAAGVVDLRDGLELVNARGRGMAEAAARHPGTMAVLLGADLELAEEACSRAGGTVVVANHNATDQVAISGSPEAVDSAIAAAKELGAKRAMSIPVGGAFHSPLIAPALATLAGAIASTPMRDPIVPVVSNVDAEIHDKADGLGPILLAQLCAPVRWVECTATLEGMGIRAFVEVGPGGVLNKLAKRAVKGALHAAVAQPQDVETVAEALRGVEPRPVSATVHSLLDTMVISPAQGTFRPATPQAYTAEGEFVNAGDVIGEVVTSGGSVPVTAGCAGWVMDFLAGQDEAVEQGAPLLAVRRF